MRRMIRELANRARAFLAPCGRHRREEPPGFLPSDPSRASTRPPSRLPVAATVRTWYEPIDGAATALVRPYLDAYEQGEKARVQRLRRDALWCATYGLDLDTRYIHNRLEAA